MEPAAYAPVVTTLESIPSIIVPPVREMPEEQRRRFILARHAALHDMLHAYRIEELVLKKDWE